MSDSKDLWELGQVKGRQDESERIIELLEKWQCFTNECNCWSENTFCDTRDALIALIKGENK